MTVKKKAAKRSAQRRSKPARNRAIVRHYVYSFDEIRRAERAAGAPGNLRGLLGGKGAHLAEMTKLGLPVPPGFVVTTEACNAFLAAGGRFPKGMWDQVLGAVDEEGREALERLR